MCGKKPFKQKGTGHASRASTNAPHWRVVCGVSVPSPAPTRNARQEDDQGRSRVCLSDRAGLGKVLVVDSWGFDTPSTRVRSPRSQPSAPGQGSRRDSAGGRRGGQSFRNLPDVHGHRGSGAERVRRVVQRCRRLHAGHAAHGQDGRRSVRPRQCGAQRRRQRTCRFRDQGHADSMLYHVPGSRYYKATKAEAWFATAEDAERAGFSAPASTKDEEGDES